MKNFLTFFTVIFLACGITIFAQDFGKKGIVEFGGGLGFTSTTYVFDGESFDDTQTSFWFYPYVGYFIINNVELGLIPRFSTSSMGDLSDNSFGILLAPAYVFDLGNCWYPFIEGRIGYNSWTYEYYDVNLDILEATESGLEWGFRGGVKAQVGRHALVNAGVFYQMIDQNNDDDPNDERDGINQFGLEVGVSVFIP